MKLALVLVVACGSSRPAPAPVANQSAPPADARPDAASPMMAASRALTDAMCRCADVADQQQAIACMQKVGDDAAAWTRDHPELADYKLTDAEMRDAQQLGDRMTKCVAKITGQSEGAP